MNIHSVVEFIEKQPRAFLYRNNNIILSYESITKVHNIARLCKNLSSLEIYLEGIPVNNYATPLSIIEL